MASGEHLWDVIEIRLKVPNVIRVMDRGMTERDAEAYIDMAVIRRGVVHSIFTKTPTGKHKDGDHFPQRFRNAD